MAGGRIVPQAVARPASNSLRMSYRIQRFGSLAELPPRYAGLQAQLAQAGLFGDAAWYALLLQQVFSLGDRLVVFGVEDADSGRPLLLAPLRSSRQDAGVPGARVLGSISHPENYAAAAFAFDDAPAAPGAATALFQSWRAGVADFDGRPVDVVRLWPMALDGGLDERLFTALQAAGYRVQPYANSYNRFETTRGLDHAQYFAQRSANLRYSVRRRRRALEKTGALEFTLVCGTEGLDRAMADYHAVARASWKAPQTMESTDMRALMRLAAERGCLRLGVLRLHGAPVAAQFWVVAGGVAHCARLAYVEAAKKLAPGVVLTDLMIAQVLDHDRVERIDFGFGREDYKGGWMKEAQLYVGLMAFNPGTWRGRWQALKHIGGQPVKRALRAALVTLRLRKPAQETGPAPGHPDD